MMNYKKHLKDINTFIFDYDGVLTDGTVILQDDGEPLRTAYVKDGYALQLAIRHGYNIAIISGGRSQSIANRLRLLNVEDVFLGVATKLEVLRDYMKTKELESKNIIFMGDDIPDYHAMKEAGIAACPADAAEEIISISDYISPYPGGKGCVRDIIEQVMKVQGKWMNDGAFLW